MRPIIGISAILAASFLSSCASSSTTTGTGPHARVLMRDGTRYAGTVTASSPTEITLAGDDGAQHSLVMTQVKTVQYDEPAAAAAVPGGAAPVAPVPGGVAPAAASDSFHEDHYHPDQTKIRTRTNQLGVGAEISVRTEETIDSSRASEGQTYAAEVTRDVMDSSGDVVIPAGSNAQIIIRSATKGGKIRGASNLILDLNSVSVEGQEYRLSTTDLQQRGRDGVGANKRTAEFSGGTAAVGAIIGAIAGGGRGAAIGAGAGAGAGAVTQMITKGSIKVPAESVLTFKLDRPLRVVAR